MNLLNHNVPIDGVLLEVAWQQHGVKRSELIQVSNELGTFALDVIGFEPGVYVPVTVSVEYIGWTFLGYTGFTPR